MTYSATRENSSLVAFLIIAPLTILAILDIIQHSFPSSLQFSISSSAVVASRQVEDLHKASGLDLS